MSDTVKAPWTEDQVKNLNAWQQFPYWHPYTCGNDSRHEDLVATKDGWICKNCDYRQDWAMAILATPPPPDELT